MFTNVGNIYTIQTGVRSAERTDAGLKMQHQQPMFGKNQNHKPRQEQRGSSTTILGGQEQNTISIDAIHDFLAKIVQSNSSKNTIQMEQDSTTPSLFDTINNEKLARLRRQYEAAKVTNAYEQASHIGQNTNVHSIDRSNKLSLGLHTVSNSDLYSLIKDIESLRKQGLQSIQIKRENTFMESLITTVDAEKAKRKTSTLV